MKLIVNKDKNDNKRFKLKTICTFQTSNHQIFIDGHSLTTEDISNAIADSKTEVLISKEALERINSSHQLLDKLVKNNRVIYGVNTSLGGFVNWLVPVEQAQELQENLIAAVATNVAPYLEERVVKASMLARLNSLARGTSAISLTNFEKLLKMFNSGIVPCVPSKGSLGASGDLGPLACIALVATGKWKAHYKGQILSGDIALNQAGIEPMKLGYKEGLSLINGTSVMAGFAALLVEDCINLIKTYDIISCLSFEGLKVKKKPFNPIVHHQKPHLGQLRTAQNIWNILDSSKMIIDEKEIEEELQGYNVSIPVSAPSAIEDAYSIRCTPQIIGPIRDNIQWIKTIITNEINSSNDNPLIICDEQDVYHNGHFHGQYVAMALDLLGICLTTLSNLADRRIDRFMDKNNSNGLPAFLCAEQPGLRLGLMGGQFMTTSLTAENRSLCTPLSIESLSSTGDFQDIVSLGLIAARRVKELYENTCYIIGFELLCGVEAANIRNSDLLSNVTRTTFELVREVVPFVSSNQYLSNSLEDIAQLIKTGILLNKIENKHGKISFL